jgi:ArsR family transcriptional regulator
MIHEGPRSAVCSGQASCFASVTATRHSPWGATVARFIGRLCAKRLQPRPLCRSGFVSRNEEADLMQTLLRPAIDPAEDLDDVESNGHVVRPALTTLADQRASELAQLFKLLADETRLKIIHYLMQKDELNVRTFCALLAQSQPAVSHHLALLKLAVILDCRRDGKHNFYRLVPRRCQEYLNVVFGVSGDQTRKVRVDEAVLTYGRDGQQA